jgi:cytochrome b561
MNERYTGTAIGLHWIIALAIAATFVLGLTMTDLPFSPTKLRLYSWHKWAGVTIFLLVIIRLGWRLTHPAPPLPATMPGPLRLAATATHWLLYALMLAIPLSGWLMSSAKGFQTVWLGILPLPDLLAKDEALGHILEAAHEALNFTLLALVVLHTAAAFKHHLIDRDTVLTRMLPHRR